MSDLLSILEEQYELLCERGYESIGLGTAEEPGVFMNQLEQVFSFHLKKSLEDKETKHFTVQAIGFFEQEKHAVSFKFHYQINSQLAKCELKSLDAEMNGIQKHFQLESIYNLPYTSRLVSDFVKEESLKQPNQLTEMQKVHLFESTLLEHWNILETKGYADKQIFPQVDDYLFHQLRAVLVEQYRKENLKEKEDIHLYNEGSFGEQDNIKFFFHYQFDQQDKSLSLNSLVAEFDGKRACYSIKKVNDLPTAIDVCKQLTNQLKNDRVKIVYPNEKIATLIREQERFLGSFGYYDTFLPNNVQVIERELESKLSALIQHITNQNIPIERTLHLGKSQSVKCVFEYSFDPLHVDLSLKKINARVGDIEKTYYPKNGSSVITVQEIHKELSQQSRLRTANEIQRRAKVKQEFYDSRRNRRRPF